MSGPAGERSLLPSGIISERNDADLVEGNSNIVRWNPAARAASELESETDKSEVEKLKRYESMSKDVDGFSPIELGGAGGVRPPANRDIEFADGPLPRAKKTGIKLDRRTTTIRSIILGDDEDNEVNLRLRRGTSRVPMEYRTMSIQVLDSIYHIQRRAETKNAETDSEFFARVDYHTVPVNVIYQRFNVSPQLGLDAAGIAKRLERHGKNILAQVRPNYVKKIALYFFGGFSSILWVGVIVNFICWKPLGEPAPQPYYVAVAIAILLVILLNAGFSAYQDWSTGNVMKSILNLIPENVTVLRDGSQVTIPAEGLVPGDIVYLTTGTKVGADMRIVQASSDLRFDRAVLTGESEEVAGVVDSEEVNFLEAKNIAFLGSHVCNGTATAVVVLTGGSSVMGRINKLTNSGKDKQTLIQKEINRFIMIIIGLTITLIVIMVIYWGAYLRKVHPDFLNVAGILSDLMGLVVAFIPEGMPVAVAMTLALVAKRMKAADVLPKSLGTVETLGCVNMICSDKTGTLTQNKMTVESVGFVDGQMTAAEALSQYTGSTMLMHEMSALQRLIHTGTICNDAFFEDAGVGGIETKERPVNGNATDAAVLRFVHGASPVDPTRSSNPRVAAIPFNSRNKWMLTAITAGDPEKGGAYVIMLKGAPDILLPYCTTAVASNGEAASSVIPLDDAARRDVVNLQETWARRGERVITMAYKRVEMSRELFETSSQEEQLAKLALSDLTLIGLVGIMDPPKLAIPATVREVRRSGSRFSVVTGDFKLTAAAIARKCGILTCSGDPYEVSNMEKASEVTEAGWLSGGLVLQGSEIDKLDDAAWETVCKFEEIVFARTSPEQKLRIVKQFQQRKQIVAVTGDGVNDAAALKAANVGIAMIEGSDVAIEAADLVLLGDFSSIVEGIRLGRLVFQNLQKVVSYLLPAGSYSEDWPVILNVFAGVPLPLSSFLMIIICCFTDLFCCLTLIVETEEDDLLSLPPRNGFTDHLVNFKLYGQAYLFLGTIETICAHAMFFLYMYQATGIPLGGLFLAYENYGSDGYYGVSADDQNNALLVGQSVYFVTLVVMQWFNLLTTRNKRLSLLQSNPITRAKNGRRNLFVPLGIFVALGIAVFVTEVPGMQRVFLTASVPIRFWLMPLALGFGMLVLDDVRKLLVRTFPKSFIARVAF